MSGAFLTSIACPPQRFIIQHDPIRVTGSIETWGAKALAGRG
jgi:hypothetical protein